MSAPVERLQRLFLDIENMPYRGWFWDTGKQYVGHHQITEEKAICIIGWAWNDDPPEYMTWDKNQSDRTMLEIISEMIARADEVVAHSGELHDLPIIRTRCLFHGLSPLPVVKLVDTCKWARKYFKFASNSLDYIHRYFGGKGKTKVNMDLWHDVNNGDLAALEKMGRYCKRDIKVLRDVWKWMRIACAPITHAGVSQGKTKGSCPRCASEKVTSQGKRITASGTVHYRMKCERCGGWFQVSEVSWKQRS